MHGGRGHFGEHALHDSTLLVVQTRFTFCKIPFAELCGLPILELEVRATTLFLDGVSYR